MGSFALGYLCHHNFHFREDKDDVLLFFAGKNNETPPQLKGDEKIEVMAEGVLGEELFFVVRHIVWI